MCVAIVVRSIAVSSNPKRVTDLMRQFAEARSGWNENDIALGTGLGLWVGRWIIVDVYMLLKVVGGFAQYLDVRAGVAYLIPSKIWPFLNRKVEHDPRGIVSVEYPVNIRYMVSDENSVCRRVGPGAQV
jgi:hypothetical protein